MSDLSICPSCGTCCGDEWHERDPNHWKLRAETAEAAVSAIDALVIECSYHGGGDPSPKCEGCATASETRAVLRLAAKEGR